MGKTGNKYMQTRYCVMKNKINEFIQKVFVMERSSEKGLSILMWENATGRSLNELSFLLEYYEILDYPDYQSDCLYHMRQKNSNKLYKRFV